MSYESRLNSFPNKVINPTYITLLVSLILHFLVYRYGLPNFSLQNKNLPEKTNVPVIELTPEESARLPNLEPELNIPELNNTSLDNGVPPFALPPAIAPNGFPDLAPIPLPPPPNFNLPPLPPFPPLPSTNINLPPIGDLSSLPLPPPLPPLESNSSENSTAIKPPTTVPTLPEKKPSEAQPPQVKPQQSQSQPTAKPQQPRQENPTRITAQRQQKLDRNIRDLSSSLQKQNTANTDEDARKNYVSWLNQIKTVNPEVMAIAGTYPRDACIRRLEGTSVYGVVADASGQVVALELIKGADYPIFNEQASQDLKKRKFKNQTNQPKPYQVTVNYKYDAEICPSLTLPSLRKESQTNQKPQNPLKPTKPTPTQSQPTKPTPTQSQPTKPTPTQSQPTKPTPTQSQPTKPTPTQSQPTKPTPTQSQPSTPK